MLKAALEVLEGGVVLVVLIHVSLLELVVIHEALHDLVRLVPDLALIVDASPLEQSLELALLLLLGQLTFSPSPSWLLLCLVTFFRRRVRIS